MPLPPIRQLEAFMTVAEARSFRIAADRMGLSQPALSQNIAQLEEYMGCALFTRTTRTVHLTAEGVELQANLSTALPALHDAIERTRNFGKAPAARVRLGFLAAAAVHFLPAALARFRTAFPDATVTVRDDSAAGLFEGIRTGALDLAVSSFLPHDPREVTFELALQDPFRAVLRRDHPLAQQDRITWDQLMAHDIIGANPDSGTRHAIDAAMKAQGRVMRTVMNLNHMSAVSAMIEARLGVGALSSINCPPADHPILCSVPLVDPVVTRDLGVLSRPVDGASSQHIRAFRDCIIGEAVKSPPGL